MSSWKLIDFLNWLPAVEDPANGLNPVQTEGFDWMSIDWNATDWICIWTSWSPFNGPVSPWMILQTWLWTIFPDNYCSMWTIWVAADCWLAAGGRREAVAAVSRALNSRTAPCASWLDGGAVKGFWFPLLTWYYDAGSVVRLSTNALIQKPCCKQFCI